MKCIILCAGYATRLYPLTLDKPKALLPILGKPLLTFLVEKVSKIPEVDEIFVVTNNKFYSHFCEWKKSLVQKNVKILNDLTLTNEARLGGLGDFCFVLNKEKICDDVLLLAGDNIFDFELTELVNFFHKVKTNSILLYDIFGKDDPRKFGIVGLNHDGEIISFEEKPSSPKSTLISTGVYVYSKNELDKVKEYMNTSLPKEGPGYLIPYFMNSQSVCGLVAKGNWYDVGSVEIYDKVKDLNFK